MTVTYHVGDTRELVRALPDRSVSLVTCSPPFIALRSYLPDDHPSKHAEIGTEPDPATFIDCLLELTHEWGRVLAPWGSIAIELGDTYAGSGGAGGDYNPGGLRDGQQRFDGSSSRAFGLGGAPRPARKSPVNTSHRLNPDGTIKRSGADRRFEPKQVERWLPVTGGAGWPRPKSLALIPQLYALSLAYGRNVLRGPMSAHDVLAWIDELRAHGYTADQALATVGGWVAEHGAQPTFTPWLVRNLVVWHRPNPAVGALGDKYRPSTSYIAVATRSPKRWFDLTAVRTALVESAPRQPGTRRFALERGGERETNTGLIHQHPAGAPPLDAWFDDDGHDLWTVTTRPSKLAHYAMWPPTLADRLVQSMCPEQVCATCGEPRRRIEHHERTFDNVTASSGRSTVAKHGGALGSTYQVSRSTVGWSDCGHDSWAPGVVLDPFAGTGTTLAVAHLRDRDAIGFDIDERNRELYPRRLAEVRRALFQTPAPAPGQIDLFGEVSA